MRYAILIPCLATAATAFVIPDEATSKQLAIVEQPEPSSRHSSWWDGIKIPSLDDLRSSVQDTFDAFDNGFKSLVDSLPDVEVELPDFLSEWDHPHKGHKGHHHHGHDISNLTIYQAIQESNFTTHFVKLLDDYPDLVETLNSTEANHTLFVPTDKAFSKIPKDHEKPSKELIERALKYHVVPGFYPAGRVLAHHTLPTLLDAPALGDDRAQRIRITFGLLGVRVNFYSKVVAANFFTKNGVIHGVDSILVPPPKIGKIVQFFPADFSTFLLASEKTNLSKELSGLSHTGATFFAPTNAAFRKLGPRANAFLFNTEKGLGYLKALLKYHMVVNETLYSDAYYGKPSDDDEVDSETARYHIDLPTLLDDKSLAVDISRWGGFISFRVNGHTQVQVQDVVAKDGVIQVVGSVLIPPHKHHGHGEEEDEMCVDGEEIEVEDLMSRLEPYLEKEENKDEGEVVWGEL